MSGTNLRILARNVLGEAGVILSANPAFVSGLDEQVLLSPTQRGVYARTSPGALFTGQRLDFDFSAIGVQRINMVAFTRLYDYHDGYSDYVLTTTRYQSGSPSIALATDVMDPAFDFSQLHRLTRYAERYCDSLRNIVQYMDLQTAVSSMTNQIDTDAVSADRYAEITHAMAGEYFEVEYDPPFGGANFGWLSSGASGRADDGTLHADVGADIRKLSIDLRFITDDDLPAMLAIAHYMYSRKAEGFIDLYPGDMSAKGIYNRFPCRLVTEPPEFSPHFVGLHSTKLVFEEV
jgi:hypothetical protein